MSQLIRPGDVLYTPDSGLRIEIIAPVERDPNCASVRILKASRPYQQLYGFEVDDILYGFDIINTFNFLLESRQPEYLH